MTPPPASDATLSALALSRITLDPAFAAETNAYAATVDYAVEKVKVKPTTNHGGAGYVIKLGGVLDADGTLALAQGANFITVEVTAEDGVSGETYAVTVTREAPASDATLSALALSRITLDPAFAAETNAYAATVDYAVDETAVTPTTNHGGAGYVIKLGGVLDADGTLALAQGDNFITVEVTAEDGVSGETYAVTVTREAPASDATLSALALSRITLDPAFAAETNAYAATVDYAVDETAVTPTTNHGGAGYVIKLGGVLDADGTLPLAQGDNFITVEVTAEDGVSGETYAVTVTREAPASDATLSALALSRITLDPAFAAETTAYAATVDYAVDETAVTPTTNHGGAGYVIKLGGVLDADGTLALAQGANFITVEVTAEDGVSGETYAVTVTREAPASDATLSALALSRITLDPAFAAETNAYAATVDYAVDETAVTPTTNHGGAGYVIKLGGVLDADGTLPLAQGDNFITVEVTAEDGVSGETYAVTVTREAPASDATLSALALSRITLDPAFAAETNAYAATVDYAVDETAVTPTTNHGGAGYVIKLGGVLDADGTLPLAQGDNFITVEVTAEDGVSGETYAVTVTREAPASDATLSALALSRITLDPAFAAETTAYAATVDYAVEKVTPTTNHGGAGYVIKLGGVLDADGTLALAQGDNFITVEVTAEDGVSGETYAVTVTREAPASDATLSALALSRITLDPAFAAETNAYAATVDYAVDETAVTPTTNHGGAGYVIKLGGVLDADGTLALAQGANVITVEVTAEDGVSGETYAVTVTREAPASDATLSALALSRITLDPAFAAETTAYAATVDYAVDETAVTPTTNHGGAGYVIKLGGVLDADGTLALAQGDNFITVEVTAEDGVSGETYAVTVTREAPASDATLSALALSRITLDPAFAAETNAYAATVDYAVDETAVTPTTNHGGAGYVIKLGGVLDADGTLALAQGDNFITVEVTAEDGVSGETYAVTVTREAPASDATLSALALSRITLDPAFAAETTAYTATVDYAVEKVKVKPTTNHGGAGYVIKLGGVLDADGTLPLAQGDNFITVEVTAEDGVSGETYAVTVTREETAARSIDSFVPILVSNTAQTANANATYSRDHGQAFTTGANAGGYTVSGVTIISTDPDDDAIALQICEVDDDTHPTSTCTDLTPPSSSAEGPLEFTIAQGTSLTLAAATTYMLVFKAPSLGQIRVAATTSDDEDSDSLPGWSIRDKFQWKNTQDMWADASRHNAIRIAILGNVAITPGLDISQAALTVVEGNAAGQSYTVALTTQPSAAVTVTISGQASSDLVVDPSSLTFSTSNWSSPQTVTVTASEDADALTDPVVTLTHTAPAGAITAR